MRATAAANARLLTGPTTKLHAPATEARENESTCCSKSLKGHKRLLTDIYSIKFSWLCLWQMKASCCCWHLRYRCYKQHLHTTAASAFHPHQLFLISGLNANLPFPPTITLALPFPELDPFTRTGTGGGGGRGPPDLDSRLAPNFAPLSSAHQAVDAAVSADDDDAADNDKQSRC